MKVLNRGIDNVRGGGGHRRSGLDLRGMWILSCLAVLISLAPTMGYAAEEGDFFELPIEALLDTDVYKITALGSHTHYAGQWMIGVHSMRMEMAGNRSGSDRVSAADVLTAFPIAPTRMTMDMHMLHAMHAPSDTMTFMIKAPLLRISMDHVTRSGVRFTTDAEGIGDLGFVGLFTVYDEGPHKVFLTGGFTAPTGSINRRDTTPAGPNQQLPYPMQLGSGTWDLVPEVNYDGQARPWGWGAKLSGTVRLGTNENRYSLGDRLRTQVWGVYEWSDRLSQTLGLDAEFWGNIDGADPALNPAMVATADPNRRAGERVDAVFGFNFYAPEGRLKGNRVGIEVGVPIYQDLDGPQLETDWITGIDWTWTF